MEYYSSSLTFSSRNGKGEGKKNIVSVKNGKGFKQVEILNSAGKTLGKTRRNLKKNEIETITRGKFMPGLWRNCSRKHCKIMKP